MTNPELTPEFSVSCRTCLVTMWSGNEPTEDGQPILNKFGDEQCPRVNCPHKQANRATDPSDTQPATLGDLKALRARLTTLEGKLK